MDVEAYLNRINYRGPRDVSAGTLRELHEAHLLAVPFENLDNHLKREIVLDEDKLVAKVVDQRRGGVCYELNGAFCSLLREVGVSCLDVLGWSRSRRGRVRSAVRSHDADGSS